MALQQLFFTVSSSQGSQSVLEDPERIEVSKISSSIVYIGIIRHVLLWQSSYSTFHALVIRIGWQYIICELRTYSHYTVSLTQLCNHPHCLMPLIDFAMPYSDHCMHSQQPPVYIPVYTILRIAKIIQPLKFSVRTNVLPGC